jgi:HK97 family phage major capsid protein
VTDILEYTKRLREERMRLIDEAKGVYDEAIEAKRAVTSEETAKVDQLDARIDEIEAEVRTLDERERREREAATSREAFERQHGTQGARRQVENEAEMMRRWARGELGKELEIPIAGAAEELRMIRGGATAADIAEYRALAWDTGNVASAVPVTTARSLYEILEATIAMFRAPTTKINTSSGEQMKFPKITAHGIATQVSGQGTALAGTDPAFNSVALDAFKYGELVRIASEVISDAAIDIIGFITRDVGRALGRNIDIDLVVGSGTGKPQGVISAAITGASGTIATGGSLITPTYENLVDLAYSVNDAYRAGGSAAWLMRDATAGVLRKLRDGAGGTIGAVLWEPSQVSGIQFNQPDRLLGFPVYTDPNVASLASNAKVMVFGDFSAYYIRTVGPVVLERDDSRFFDTDETAIRGKWRVDGDVVDVTALNLLKQSV